jgi:hypothetical protein
MTNYENTNCELSPLDAAMYELIETRKQLEAQQDELAASLAMLERIRQQLEAERAAHSLTRVNMAWQIMDLKCREVK